MNPLILLITPDKPLRSRLRACLEDEDEAEILEWGDPLAALDWLKENDRQVDAAFVGGSSRIGEPVALELRAQKSTCACLIFQLTEGHEGWGAWTPSADLLDHILLKPLDTDAFTLRLKRLSRGGSALVFGNSQTSPVVGGDLAERLSQAGFLKVIETADLDAAFQCLTDKKKEIQLVLCDLDSPSIDETRFLRLFFSAPDRANLDVNILASLNSLRRLQQGQLAALEINGFLSVCDEENRLRNQLLPALARIQKHRRAESFLKESRLFLSRGKNDFAKDLLRHAVKTLPGSARLFTALGDCLLPEAPGEAISAYESARRLEPGASPWEAKCLEYYASRARLTDAIRVAEQCVARRVFDDGWRVRLAELYLKFGDEVAASQELRRALTANPSNQQAALLLQPLTLDKK